MALPTDKQPKLLQNTFTKGMNLDSPESLMPDGFWRHAHNTVIETETESQFGVASEASNDIFTALPSNAFPRGYHFLEERDWHIFFSNINGQSEIGYVDAATKTYHVIYNDCQDILDFGTDTWIPIQSKTMQPCNEVHLYWAVRDFYFRLNIDDVDEIEDCTDLYLFQPNCVSKIVNATTEKGGNNLLGGAYDVVAQLEDEDGNVTNWFNFGNTVYLGTENNTADEVSEEGISISIRNLGKNYVKVNLAVFHNGNTIGKQIVSLPYSSNGIEYFYSSTDQYIRDVDITEVLAKKNGYPRGSDLQQYDGRLFLYNVRGERNLDYQERALRITPKYVVGRVPMKYSHMFKGLRGGETYAVSIHWNYVDGTRTRSFHIGNVETTGSADGQACDSCGGKNAGNNASGSSTGQDVFSVSNAVRSGTTREDETTDYVPYTPTNQDLYDFEDVDMPDVTDVPDPNKQGGDGNDCDCAVICQGIPGGGADRWPRPFPLNDNYYQEIYARILVAKAKCDCDCLGGVSGTVTQPRESGGVDDNSVLSYNDSDVEEILAYFRFQEASLEGTLTEQDVKDYLDSQFTYDNTSVGLRGSTQYDGGGEPRTEGGQDGTLGDSDCFNEGDVDTGNPYGNEKPLGEPTGGEGDTIETLVGSRTSTSGLTEEEEPSDFVDDSRANKQGKVCDEYDASIGGDRDRLNNYSDAASQQTVENKDNGSGAEYTTEGTGQDADIDNDCIPEVVVKEGTCCEVERVIPCIDARGTLSAWESCETYPTSKRCDSEEFIYGDYAGKPIRHLKMPNRAIEPHFVSYNRGVPTANNRDNDEYKDTYARFIWLELDNIERPKEEELDKPLCEKNPFTISIVKRDVVNKTVIASGLARNTFKGEVYGRTNLYPKHGLNSDVFVSRYIENTGDNRRVGEVNGDVPAYTFLSPDTAFDRPNLRVDRFNFNLTLDGLGYRHGLYAEGVRPDGFFVDTAHTKGARQSLYLSQYSSLGEQRCYKAASYAPADTVVDRGDNFTHSLVNMGRESSVYFETEGGLIDVQAISEDEDKDTSFDRDIEQHTKWITGKGLYVDFIKDNPNQYGRLENLTYIPIYEGTVEDLSKGKCVVQGGDSFIGLHSVKTTSYVSDRVGVSNVSRSLAKQLEFGGGIANLPLIGGLVKHIFSAVGAEKCGTIPQQGDGARGLDPRANNDRNGSGTAQNYFPQLQKTLITFPVESDVNLHYRGGTDSKSTAHYRDLNGLTVDSSFGGGEGGYENAFLDEYWATMSELSSGRQLLRVLLNMIWTFGIGLYILIDGWVNLIENLENTQVGTTNTVGAPWAIGLSILQIVIGALWIILWANTNLDNKFFDSILGIKDCYPDKFIGGQGDADGKMDDDRVIWHHRPGLKDEYYKYEYASYSRINNLDFNLGLPFNYNTCDCLGDKTYQILYSDKQDPTSWRDAYRNFRVNSYLEIPNETGRMTNMFKRANKLFVHTTDTIWSLEAGSTTLGTEGGTSIYLGRPDVLQKPINVYDGPSEGFAGNLDPNASINTKWGYIWVDREARKLYMYNSSGLEELGASTMRNFFRENMDLKFLDSFPDYALVDEKVDVGYSIGVDYRHDRLIITKRDYAPKQGVGSVELLGGGRCNIGGNEVNIGDSEYFDDYSWTLSYSFGLKNFVSFHSYKPLFYMWDRYDMFSYGNSAMYIHNVNGSHREFYGEQYPWVISFSVADINTTELQDTTIYSESRVWDGETYIQSAKIPFDKIGVFNTNQATGLLPTYQINEDDALAGSVEYSGGDSIRVDYLPNQSFRLNDFSDNVIDENVRILNPFRGGLPLSFNNGNLGEPNGNDKFLDIYIGYILYYNGEGNKNILLKRVVTNSDTETI